VEILVALLAGLLGGVLAAAGLFFSVRRTPPSAPVPAATPQRSIELPGRLLDVLRSGAVVLDSADDVVLANAAARGMGVVRNGRLAVDELRRLARRVRRESVDSDVELQLPHGRMGREPTAVRARIVALGEGFVALVVEDITESRRVEAVRRDFVANVSHELKTPVGALSLLAEASADAADDPEAVRRFSARMQHESSRLARLVQELIDLSRLQGADPLPSATVVPVERVVTEAIDRTRLAAAARLISVVSGGDRGLFVLGSESQLVTCLANLVDNAITYSPEHTKVAIGLRRREVDDDTAVGGSRPVVEISVSDQGMGIPERDLERVFERFYRSDPARSRATGGTGLGLAIVKHIASNHGGSVSVWSVEGSGSTFTIRLPLACAPDGADLLSAASHARAGSPRTDRALGSPSGLEPAGGRAPTAQVPTAQVPTGQVPTAQVPTEDAPAAAPVSSRGGS